MKEKNELERQLKLLSTNKKQGSKGMISTNRKHGSNGMTPYQNNLQVFCKRASENVYHL